MTPAPRYTAVAVALHWAIAAAVLANLALGWWMHRAVEVAATQAQAITAFQLHKSLGLTVLALTLLRIAWRLLHRPPPLPAAMPGWERLAAKATHAALYALMLGLPLSGWLYVSAQWRGSAPLNVPTLWFGLFEVPHLFGLDAMENTARQQLAGTAFPAHRALAWSMAALLVLHVAAALKHHFVNRDEVLVGMLPARTATRAAGSLAIAAGIVALVFAVLRTPAPGSTAAVGSAAVGSGQGNWQVDAASSEIAFSGTHAGVAFRGRFTRWSAEIQFDPANPAAASITAVVETASATDGVPLHDETLPQAEWFDVGHHPTATFRSTAIRPVGERFEISGRLQIKDRELAVAPLSLAVVGEKLEIQGGTRISRADANLGMESDPDAAYVSRDIDVQVRVSARRR